MRLACESAKVGVLFLASALVAGPALAQGEERASSALDCPNLPLAMPSDEKLLVAFMGVSTLLFDDGQTQLLTDGFFSRPDLVQVTRPIAPDTMRIARALERAQITKLAAVIPLHSHYDHAMDAPVVAMKTGAMILGSESTANIALGLDVPDDRIRVFRAGQKFTFGRLELDIVQTRHSPGSEGGSISTPLRPPAPASDYKEGGTYSIVVSHRGRRLLVGTPADAATPPQAEVVFLSLAVRDPIGVTEEYWRQVWQRAVVATGARRVIPVHWDNFFYPLEAGLVPFAPPFFPDVAKVLRYLQSFAKSNGIDVRCAPLWDKVDPFKGL